MKKKISGKITFFPFFFILTGISREAREESENSRELKSAKIREKQKP